MDDATLEASSPADTLFNRFQTGFGHISLLRGAGIAALFALTILVSRTLGPGGQGVYATILVVTGVAVQVGNCGLHAANTYLVAGNPNRASTLARHSMLWSLVVGAALAGNLVALAHFSPPLWGELDPRNFLIFTLAIPFLLATLLLQGLLLGLHRTRAYLSIEVMGRLALLVATALALLRFHTGLTTFVLLWTLAQVATGIGYALYSRQIVGRPARPAQESLLKSALRYGVRAYLTSLFGFLVLRSDILLVNYFVGTSAGGIYSVAGLLSEQMLLLPALLGTALFPLVSSDPAGGQQLTPKVMRHVTPLLLLVCALAALLARPLVVFFYGREFAQAGTMFLILLPGIFLLSLQVVLAHHLAGTGYPWGMVYIWGGGFLLNLLANLYAIPRWGMVAAAVVSTLTYSFVFLLILRLYRHQSRTDLSDLFRPRRDELRLLLERIR